MSDGWTRGKGMKEKKWRKGVLEKMEGGRPVSYSGVKPVTGSDVYRDANSAFGTLIKELARFLGGDKAANRIKVGGSGRGRGRGRAQKAKRKGWF